MPAPAKRRHLQPQIALRTQLVPLTAAREVVDEASHWLGQRLPTRYAFGLAARAHVTYANSPSFRRTVEGLGDAGREKLYLYLRHWLAARLHTERPHLFARLLRDYATGAEWPVTPLRREFRAQETVATPGGGAVDPDFFQFLG